jgi:putative glutamine transport system substrate-binding protein
MVARRLAIAIIAVFIAAAATLPARADTSGNTLDAIKARGVLKIGVKYDSPPFGVLDPKTNQVEGFDIDVAHALAKAILGDPNKVQFTQVNSSTRIPLVQNGDIDMFIATATITPARLQQIDFSNVYYIAGESLLVKKNSPIKSYKDLGGKSVCTTAGSTEDTEIRQLAPTANVQTFDSYASCFTALQSGRIDAMTTDNTILVGYQQQDPADFALVGGLLSFEPYGIGIAKGNVTLLKAVNAALATLVKSKDYDKMNEMWNHSPLTPDVKSQLGMDAAMAGDKFAAGQPKK